MRTRSCGCRPRQPGVTTVTSVFCHVLDESTEPSRGMAMPQRGCDSASLGQAAASMASGGFDWLIGVGFAGFALGTGALLASESQPKPWRAMKLTWRIRLARARKLESMLIPDASTRPGASRCKGGRRHEWRALPVRPEFGEAR